ncbi:MAG: macro domain-containing protein [Candidatus Absconditabacterales bacterium]
MNKKDSLTKFPQSSNRNKTGVGNIILTLLTSGEKGENAINIVEEGLPISLVLGDMTQISADAYIVPHFNGEASFGGVGGAIANGGAIKGMEEYEQMVEQEKKAKGGSIENFQEWSKATVTESGGGNSKFLIHVVSVDSGKENEFDVVSGAVYNALSEATKRGLKNVVIPLVNGYYRRFDC